MINRILQTTGAGIFSETEYQILPISSDEITVRAVMTGVCRSDIDMMQGNFGPLPLHMQGHEGIGQVIAIGSDIRDVHINQYVATRGEPAYADIYNVRSNEYVKIPEVHPRYILEPVACGINMVIHPFREIAERAGPGRRLLILGSGFLAWVAYNTLLLNDLDFEITVVGNSNKELWGNKLSQYYGGKFDVILDLSDRADIFYKDMLHNEALVIFGAQKKVTTNFANLLWSAGTIMFPSPRTDNFISCMRLAEHWITIGNLNVDSFWTRGYDRNTEWKEAFLDGANRPDGYSRGYIVW